MWKIIIILVMSTAVAFAQQAAQPSAGEQALSNELLKQLQSSVQTSTQLIETQLYGLLMENA
jgi:hypothetical protein